VKTQNRERQRKGKKRRGLDSISNMVTLTAMPFKVWNILKQFHPYKNEILNVVRLLNSLGVNCRIIAATLGLQGWKTFYGTGEWKEEDVKGLLERYGE
jgi:hypothetical protein